MCKKPVVHFELMRIFVFIFAAAALLGSCSDTQPSDDKSQVEPNSSPTNEVSEEEQKRLMEELGY